MAVGHLQRFGVADIYFMLAESPFALRGFDRHSGRFEMSPDGGGERLGPRALKDVIVLEIPARRLQTAITDLVGLPVAVLNDVVLHLRRRIRGDAEIASRFGLPP